MTGIQEQIIKPKLGLLELAKQLSSVNRDSFQQFRELYKQGGGDPEGRTH